MKLIIIPVLLVGFAVLLFALRLIIKGDKNPRSSYIEDGKALKKRSIGCANKQMAELATRQDLVDRIADDSQQFSPHLQPNQYNIYMNKKFILLLPLLIASLLPGSCNQKQNGQPTTSDSLTTTITNLMYQLKVGVVSLDPLYKNYEYYTQANKQIEAQLKCSQQALTNKAQKAQQAYASYMEKVQKGFFIAQVQVDTGKRRIAAVQQEGAQLEQRYAEEAMKAQVDAQRALHDEAVAQLKVFNADKKYDLIPTFTGLEGVIYAGEGFDVTKEVLDLLNTAHKAKANDTKKPKK